MIDKYAVLPRYHVGRSRQAARLHRLLRPTTVAGCRLDNLSMPDTTPKAVSFPLGNEVVRWDELVLANLHPPLLSYGSRTRAALAGNPTG